jgi:hypothetical protein
MAEKKQKADHDVLLARARLALQLYRATHDGVIERVLTRDEIRSVLLPALGLDEE